MMQFRRMVGVGCIGVVLTVSLALLGSFANWSSLFVKPVIAAPKGSPWGSSYFPNLTVVDQHNRTYRFYDDLIKDRIVVVNFIYTHCPDICGLQTARMALVQDKLGERLGRDVFIYSISLDPKRDTPEVLRSYAAAFGTKPGWLFLTGDPDDVHKIRYKLGERSRSLAEHRNDAVLGNDRTGEWGRSSMMANLETLTRNIIEMDPENRKARPTARRTRGYEHARKLKLGSQRGQALFLKACAACHSIGMGKRVGPDLEDVTSRRKHEWLVEYMVEPGRVRARHDPIALSLTKQFPGVRMPDLGLAEIDASDVIAYLKAETKRLRGAGSANHGAHSGHVAQGGHANHAGHARDGDSTSNSSGNSDHAGKH